MLAQGRDALQEPSNCLNTPKGRLFSRFLGVFLRPVKQAFRLVKTLSSTSRRKQAILVVACLLVPLGVLLSVLTPTAQAATSTTITFQGRLLTSTGTTVPDGSYNMQFNLYTVASGGSTQWTDSRLVNATQGITLKNGYFSVNLADTSVGGTAFPSTINWDQEQWLGLTVRGTNSCTPFSSCATPADAEMTPRFKLTAVPFAFQAANALGVSSNNTSTASTNTNNVTIQSGNAAGTTSNSGNVILDAGTATGTAGVITLGASNASALTLGRSGLTTNNAGNLTVTGGTLTAGTAAQAGSLVVSDGSSNTGTILVQATSGNYTFTIPAVTANDTFCLATLNNCTGSATTLQNAYTNDADGSDAVIVLTAADGAVVIRDAASTVTNLFTIEANGGTDYLAVTNTSITAGLDVVLAASKSLTVTGGNTASRPASPTEGMVYFDTTTKSLLVYSNGKWQADRTTATYIVATSNAVNKDKADYVATGTSDQTPINNAITAANTAGGGTVYLTEGTFTIDAQITIKANVTLIGSGSGTVITIANALNPASITFINRSAAGITGVEVRNMRLEGNGTNNTITTHTGINFDGGTANDPGIIIDNVEINGFEDYSIWLDGIDNTVSNSSFDCEDQASLNYGIYLSNADYNTISNNFVTQCGIGIGGNSSQATNNKIIGNTVTNPTSGTYYAIDVAGPYTTIANNVVSLDISADAITVGSNATITGNAIYGTGSVGTGFYAISANDSVISGNTVTGVVNGITSNSSDRIIFTNNIITNTSQAGIELYGGSDDWQIIGNQISGGSVDGILLGVSGASRNTISNNTLYNNTGSGTRSSIRIGETAGTFADNIITNNRITDTAGTGYAIYVTSLASNTYLANNTYSGTGAATINDVGTNTIYAGQLTPAAVLQHSSSLIKGNATVVLTGSIDPIASTTLTGVGTKFLTELQVGDRITVSAETRTVTAIASDTSLTVDVATTNTANDTTPDRLVAALVVKDSSNAAKIVVDDLGALNVWSGTVSVGTSSQAGSLVVSDGSSNTGTILVQATSGNYTFTIPTTTANDTFCLATLNNCAGSGNVLQNGNSFGAAMTIGTNDTYDLNFETNGITRLTVNATTGDVNFTGNVVLAASKSLTVTGGNTASRPGSPTEGMVYYDTTTKQLLTYANGKWQGDRSTATKIVATATSAQTSRDAADFVGNGNTGSANDGDQVEINAAISALPAGGGVVYLSEGTYVIDNSIIIPSNVVLAGSGDATAITLPASFGTSINMVINSNTTTGNDNIKVRDLLIDGSNGTGGTQNAIFFDKVGVAATNRGATIEGVSIKGMRFYPIEFYNSYNGQIRGNKIYGTAIGWGIHTLGSSYTLITNNTMVGAATGGSAIEVEDGSNNTASDNISNLAGDGVVFYNSPNGTVSGNNITNPLGRGVSIQLSDYTNVSDNTVTSTSFSEGILLLSSNSSIISGNSIRDTASHGINITSSVGNLIDGNFIYNSGGTGSSNGINVTDWDNRITNNWIEDTAGTGYAISITAGTGSYLAGNHFEGTGASSINDAGTATVFGGQAMTTDGDVKFRSANSASAFYVQNARKEAGLEVDDRITLSLKTDDTELEKAITEHKDTIVAETLAHGLHAHKSEGFEKTVKIEGAELLLQLAKA